MSDLPTYHIVKGVVTDVEDVHPHAKLGDVEWQFSDGPPGERGGSEDFLSLEEGIAALAPAIFIVKPEYL